MIPAIECDQTGRPWVEFRGDRLCRLYISECAYALPLWDVCDINHVHCFDLRWKFLLSPHIRLARFVLVFAVRSLPFVFSVELAGLLEDPTFSVSMICRFFGGAMDLAQSIQDFIQARWSLFVALKWLLSLTGSRAPESGVDRHVVRTIVIPTLVLSAPSLSVAISNFGCAWVTGASTGQPAVFVRTKAGHKAC